MEPKPQLWSLERPIKIWLIFIEVGFWFFYAKTSTGFVLRVGSGPKPHLQKCVDMQASMSYLGLGTMCEVISPNFHALNGGDWPDWPRVTWDSCVNRPLVVFWGLSSTHFYLALVSSKVHIHWLSKTNQSTKQHFLGRHVCCRLEFAQHRQDRHVHDWYRVILVITYKQLI